MGISIIILKASEIERKFQNMSSEEFLVNEVHEVNAVDFHLVFC